jgi:hypothetical protein
MVKTLDPVIKEAFKKVGFTEEEVKDGCWLLERNEKKIAWIALHKFLEKVAQRVGIVFDEPKVMNCTDGEVALWVSGGYENQKAWSIGEASPKNCKNDYRWAMAEKRAKDRVILKLLGIAGDMYSEEEADEFKQKEKTPAQKAQETRAKNKLSQQQAEETAKRATDWLNEQADASIEIYSEDWKKLSALESDLREWRSAMLDGFSVLFRKKVKPDEIPY